MQAISWILIGGGAGLSAYSTIQGGKEAAEAGKIRQQQFEAEADATIAAGMEESGARRKEGRELTASQIAAFSVSGGLVGSNLVRMAETARNVEADALTIERNAQIRATSLRTQGEWARYEGQLARRNARIRAFTGVAGTAGRLYLMHKYPQPKSSGAGTNLGGTTWNRVKKSMADPNYYSRL